jgi:hypothetical protein
MLQEVDIMGYVNMRCSSHHLPQIANIQLFTFSKFCQPSQNAQHEYYGDSNIAEIKQNRLYKFVRILQMLIFKIVDLFFRCIHLIFLHMDQ